MLELIQSLKLNINLMYAVARILTVAEKKLPIKNTLLALYCATLMIQQLWTGVSLFSYSKILLSTWNFSLSGHVGFQFLVIACMIGKARVLSWNYFSTGTKITLLPIKKFIFTLKNVCFFFLTFSRKYFSSLSEQLYNHLPH